MLSLIGFVAQVLSDIRVFDLSSTFDLLVYSSGPGIKLQWSQCFVFVFFFIWFVKYVE